MKKRFSIFLLICCVYSFKIHGQATDNAGKDLFVVKNTSSFSFPLTITGFSISHTGSMNDVDSFKISKKRFDNKRGRGTFVSNGDNTYLRIVDRNNNLKSYFSNYFLADSILLND